MGMYSCCCGPTGHTLAGCGCSNIPDTIYMRVATPKTQHSTFADSYTYSPATPSSLRFQTLPADCVPTGGGGGVTSYYSDAKYPVYQYASGWNFYGMARFYMLCGGGGSYFVGFVYTNDPPLTGTSAVGQLNVLVGFNPSDPGNTCSPFRMYQTSVGNANGIAIDATASDSPPTKAPGIMGAVPSRRTLPAPFVPRFS